MKINYSSWLSDRLGVWEEHIDFSEGTTISNIVDQLAGKDPTYRSVFKNKDILKAAINGQLVSDEFVPEKNAEVTFFAPMSGG